MYLLYLHCIWYIAHEMWFLYRTSFAVISLSLMDRFRCSMDNKKGLKRTILLSLFSSLILCATPVQDVYYMYICLQEQCIARRRKTRA